jgi:cytochrome c oxidase subunit 2
MHSFFVPSLAVQIYAFIGRTNEAWIDVPVGSQTYYGQCNQICGGNPGFMPIVVKGLAKAEYGAWLSKAQKRICIERYRSCATRSYFGFSQINK